MTGNTIASVSGIDSDNGAGSNAETDEAHRHDDGNGLPQRRGEVANGVIDDKRLIGHEDGLDAEGQIDPDLAHRLLDIPSKGQNIAAHPHRDGNADGRLSVHPKHGLRRVRIGAVNLGDVAQPDQTPIRDKIHRKDVLLGLECARYAQDEPFVPGLQNPGWAYDVLRRQRGG